MNHVNAGSVISDEIKAMQEEQQETFRRNVRAKLRAINDLNIQISRLQSELQKARDDLREMGYTPIDPVELLGFGGNNASASESPRSR